MAVNDEVGALQQVPLATVYQRHGLVTARKKLGEFDSVKAIFGRTTGGVVEVVALMRSTQELVLGPRTG